MSYRFLAGETADEAFRRCAAEQLDRAIEELSVGVKGDPAAAVHAARKALKKERALLRLVRGSLKRSTRRRQNAALREAGRKLSSTRDADVMIQALDDLSERYAGQLPKRSFTMVRATLSAQREATRRALSESRVIEDVSESLKPVRDAARDMHLNRNGFSAVEPGLGRAYGRGRAAFIRARKQPTVENLHEWRKRAKDLWYDLRLLEPAAEQTLKGHAKAAHRLSDLLGDDHDLAVLRESLTATGDELPIDLDSVLALVDLRREELQEQAMLLGARVYAEKPAAFVGRMQRYWKAWQSEIKAGEAHQPARVARRTRMPAAA